MTMTIVPSNSVGKLVPVLHVPLGFRAKLKVDAAVENGIAQWPGVDTACIAETVLATWTDKMVIPQRDNTGRIGYTAAAAAAAGPRC